MPYLGEIAALITAFLWSGTSIAFTEAAVRVGSMIVNITRMIIATILLFATIILFGLELNLSSNQIINLALSGVIGLVLGDGFLFKAFQLIGARLSMLIMSTVPAISALLAFFFLNEILSIWEIIGIVITVFGIAIVVLQRKKSPLRRTRLVELEFSSDYLGQLVKP